MYIYFLLTCVVVGCLERKGISGGQRRRVSVAIEMMKEADMFLLDGMRLRMCDNIRWPIRSQIVSVWEGLRNKLSLLCTNLEPTSGLDSGTSISLMNCLHSLSSLGTNIVATLHQPRNEIFHLVNHVILLAPGGPIYMSNWSGVLCCDAFQYIYGCHLTWHFIAIVKNKQRFTMSSITISSIASNDRISYDIIWCYVATPYDNVHT